MDSSDNGENLPPKKITSSNLFDHFAQATTLKQVQSIFYQICITEGIDTTDYLNIYSQLRKIDEGKANSKAEKLWTFLDKRRNFQEYGRQKICQNMNVLIIGAGPCGLRAAIEAALLGAKVVVVEQRDKFSRNNVLHLWEFVIQDLKALGAKIFYPKFCTGSIEHISIRQLQCILMKVALVLGVQIFDGISFSEILEPTTQNIGWKAKFEPHNHLLADYQFDVLIGADGKRNTLPGFPRQVVRGKLAIGITANFVNKKSSAEEKVQEISGVAYIFNQTFFKDMFAKTGIDLENIVYYKDETHYFVMCAKKQSLLAKGVIKKDNDDINLLLSRENVDQEMLCKYAMQAADFATEGKLPQLEYSLNHRSQCDVAMFDFTALYSALHSTHLIERQNESLIVSIVGDSLHEPFWPTGSGCARGFLGVFDAAWMLRNFGLNQQSAAEIIAERENVLKLLAQTTKEKMCKSYHKYTINPKTRYQSIARSVELQQIIETQLDSDNPQHQFNEFYLPSWSNAKANMDFDRKSRLLKFCQLAITQALNPLKVKIINFDAMSWNDGRALAGLILKFKPNLINFVELCSKNTPEFILNSVTELIEQEYGIQKPPLSIFTNDKNETALVQYIEKVVINLRRDAGFEEHMISGTLKASMNSRKRPKAIDVSNVPKGEGIKRRAEMLKGLLHGGVIVSEDSEITPTCSTATPIEEQHPLIIKTETNNEESDLYATLTKHQKVPQGTLTKKNIESHSRNEINKDPKPVSIHLNTPYQEATLKRKAVTAVLEKMAENPENKQYSTLDFEKMVNKVVETLVDDVPINPPLIYPQLPLKFEEVPLKVQKEKEEKLPTPPPRIFSLKIEDRKDTNAKEEEKLPPVILRTPSPPPRNTSIRKGMFILSSKESSVDEPAETQFDVPPRPPKETKPSPSALPRHLSLSISRPSTIEDPWIKNTPTPEVFQETSHPLNPIIPIKNNVEARQSVNLLSNAPTMKRAERVAFVPKSFRTNTMKTRPSDKEKFMEYFYQAKADTLPSSFSKLGLTLNEFKKYMEEDISGSSEDSDSDDTVSTLATDSDWENEVMKYVYGDDSLSEPESLRSDSDDELDVHQFKRQS